MAADLDPLIRVRKHVVEQKQKFLAELYRQAEELAAQKVTLEKQHEEEREKLKDMAADMMSYFGPYSDAVKARVQDIEQNISQLEARIEIAREDMRAAFAELKKVEITQENREEDIAKEIKAKETQILDEIAIDNYRRRQSEEE